MVFASCGGGDSEITLSEEATQLIDDWMEGWQAGDPATVAALFSEDGVWQDNTGRYEGHEAIMADVRERASFGSNYRRTGDLVATGDGTFVFPGAYDWQGQVVVAEMEVALEEGLIVRLEAVSKEIREQD
jgi:nuclear transport factor 2 (NTF2) superfamily protein